MRRKARAFTLIELLCVTAIIGILASLLLGAVSRAFGRAKQFEWEHKSSELTSRFCDRMRQHFPSAANYPAITVDQMYEGRLIETSLRDFLKDRRVKFYPFSSKTPNTALILEVEVSKKTKRFTFKADLALED